MLLDSCALIQKFSGSLHLFYVSLCFRPDPIFHWFEVKIFQIKLNGHSSNEYSILLIGCEFCNFILFPPFICFRCWTEGLR